MNMPPQQNPMPESQTPVSHQSGAKGIVFWIVGIVVLVGVVAVLWWAMTTNPDAPSLIEPNTPAQEQGTVGTSDTASDILNDIEGLEVNTLDSEFQAIDQQVGQL